MAARMPARGASVLATVFSPLHGAAAALTALTRSAGPVPLVVSPAGGAAIMLNVWSARQVRDILR